MGDGYLSALTVKQRLRLEAWLRRTKITPEEGDAR